MLVKLSWLVVLYVLYNQSMAVSWQTLRTPPTALAEAGLTSDPDNSDPDNSNPDNSNPDNSDERVRDGPEPDPRDAEILTPLPREFADGDARRAALRELVLRALI